MGYRVSPTLSTVQARLLTATVEPAIAALRFPPFFHFFSTTRAGGQKVRRRQTKWLGGDLGPPFGRPEPPGSQFLVWFSLGRLKVTGRVERGACVQASSRCVGCAVSVFPRIDGETEGSRRLRRFRFSFFPSSFCRTDSGRAAL